MKSTKLLPILLFLFILVDVSFAFPCERTSNESICESVALLNISETEEDALYSALVYEDSSYPNHALVKEYNLNISMNESPNEFFVRDGRFIKNAWLVLASIMPSVYQGVTLLVPEETSVLSHYDYDISIPPDEFYSFYEGMDGQVCRVHHKLSSDIASVTVLLDEDEIGNGTLADVHVLNSGALSSQLRIDAIVKQDVYVWDEYCCRRGKSGGCIRWCGRCEPSYSETLSDRVVVSQMRNVELSEVKPVASVTPLKKYYGSTLGNFTATNYSTLVLSLQDSIYTEQNYFYDLRFDLKPYYFATLVAKKSGNKIRKNIQVVNQTFVVKNVANCSVSAFNHFYNSTTDCNLEIDEEYGKFPEKESNIDYSFLVHLLVVLGILYVLYRVFKSKVKLLPLLLLIIVPTVSAAETECGITNLATCIPEKMYDFFLLVINAPLLPMLIAIENLLTADISIEIFHHLWSIVRYILSLFYLFFFLYAGGVFLTSNAEPARRSQAKELLKNTVIMILLIQSSYYLYGLLLEVSSSLSSSILTMVKPEFFLLTTDSIVNIGLEISFSLFYMLILFLTMLFLALRYLIVSFGVVLFPITIFLYFLPPLREYGEFFLHILFIFIFVPFFDLLIIYASSMLLEVPLFENLKILVMITCFMIVNYTLWLSIKFAMGTSANATVKQDLRQTANYIAQLRKHL